jgi:predicted O-methyltransferase YrrM
MDRINKYIENYISYDNVRLPEIEKEGEEREDIQPFIGRQTCKLLGLIIRSVKTQRVLEFGTCLGYSTVWLAEALKETGGKLISVEYRKDLFEATKRNVEAAGLTDVVQLILGDASEIVKTLEGPFDMILQDSDKNLYSSMLEDCMRLTRKNGFIIADDALFEPMGIPQKFSRPVHEYIEKVFSDSRLYSTILPIGDGLIISVKVTD